jgi:S-adenosylmethionine synthetase
MSIYKTAESVSPKHPDKMCDQISDALLDAHLTQDPDARVAVDVAGGHGYVFVTGEVTSGAVGIDVSQIVKRIVGKDVRVIEHIAIQSPEIAAGVDTGGAGDQGIMVGYATKETPELLPLEVVLSRRLNQHLYSKWPFDGKTQVTLKDTKVISIVASFKKWVLINNIDIHKGIEYHVNPSGDWEIGGFDADAGLTGRKLIVDNYGPRISIGGGAFSGKDPSKVDRSAAYIARRIAIDYLKKRDASEVSVYLAYAIGYAMPLESTVLIDGIPEQIEGYDLTPKGIIQFLNLKTAIYENTAQYGHFGHAGYSWDI